MSDEIMLVFGEDGVAREYDDTWDITIHCESEEEQKAVLEKLNNSNQEPQELSKNSPKLDKKNGDLQPTCNQLAKDTNVPCKDTISRQAAVDALVKAIRKDPYYDSNEAINGLGVCDVRVILNDLPSAQPVPQWIPVSERLPDMWDERYLVSLAWGGIGVMEYKSTGFHNYGSFTPVPIESITAWMPLPEPYREVKWR